MDIARAWRWAHSPPSTSGETAGAIAPRVGFSDQAVRNVIRAFTRTGLAALRRGSPRNHVMYSSFDTAAAEALRDLLEPTALHWHAGTLLCGDNFTLCDLRRVREEEG